MKYWVAKCCIPEVNILLYFAKAKKPTMDEVDAAWQKRGSSPLVREKNLPLRDSYPACVGIEQIEMTELK